MKRARKKMPSYKEGCTVGMVPIASSVSKREQFKGNQSPTGRTAQYDGVERPHMFKRPNETKAQRVERQRNSTLAKGKPHVVEAKLNYMTGMTEQLIREK